MNPTSRAILQSVIATDAALTGAERHVVQRLLSGETNVIPMASGGDERLLVTQKRAAELLSVNRVTIWRMTRDCVLHPVEILPGMWRYPFREIAHLARQGAEELGASTGAKERTKVAQSA